jgi:hypothetical protein
MKLKPLREAVQTKYFNLIRNAWRGALVAASMTATSLGGCGPGLDSRYVDTALDQGDLDGTVDECDPADGTTECPDGT